MSSEEPSLSSSGGVSSESESSKMSDFFFLFLAGALRCLDSYARDDWVLVLDFLGWLDLDFVDGEGTGDWRRESLSRGTDVAGSEGDGSG
jgi:hypothetical protein